MLLDVIAQCSDPLHLLFTQLDLRRAEVLFNIRNLLAPGYGDDVVPLRKQPRKRNLGGCGVRVGFPDGAQRVGEGVDAREVLCAVFGDVTTPVVLW